MKEYKEDKKDLLKKVFSSLIQAVVKSVLTTIIVSVSNIYIYFNCKYYRICTDSHTYYVEKYEIVDKDTIRIVYFGKDIEIKGNFTIVEPLKNKNVKEHI